MLIRVGNMEVDVEIRKVSSWEIKVLLRNEVSESDTNPHTISMIVYPQQALPGND